MSDRAVRGLERRAAAGDAEAAAELLVARHRLGRLPEERLRLAAHLGDPAAVDAARRLLHVAPKRQQLGAWVRTIGYPHLKTWPRELPWTPLVQPVCARACLAALDLALPVWTGAAWRDEQDDEDGDAHLLLATLADVRDWVQAPSQGLADRVWDRVGGGCSGTLDVVAVELISVVNQPLAPQARLAHSRQRDVARSAADVIEAAARALAWDQDTRRAEEFLRAAIRSAAVPWLLGD